MQFGVVALVYVSCTNISSVSAVVSCSYMYTLAHACTCTQAHITIYTYSQHVQMQVKHIVLFLKSVCVAHSWTLQLSQTMQAEDRARSPELRPKIAACRQRVQGFWAIRQARWNKNRQREHRMAQLPLTHLGLTDNDGHLGFLQI